MKANPVAKNDELETVAIEVVRTIWRFWRTRSEKEDTSGFTGLYTFLCLAYVSVTLNFEAQQETVNLVHAISVHWRSWKS
jgi:hypothetical protein